MGAVTGFLLMIGVALAGEPDPSQRDPIRCLGLNPQDIRIQDPQAFLRFRDAYFYAIALPDTPAEIRELYHAAFVKLTNARPHLNPVTISEFSGVKLSEMVRELREVAEDSHLITVERYMSEFLDARKVPGWRAMETLTAAFSSAMEAIEFDRFFAMGQKVDLPALFSVALVMRGQARRDFFLDAQIWLEKQPGGKPFADVIMHRLEPASTPEILEGLMKIVPIPNGRESSPWSRVFRSHVNAQFYSDEGFNAHSVRWAQFAALLGRENPNDFSTLTTLQRAHHFIVSQNRSVPPRIQRRLEETLLKESAGGSSSDAPPLMRDLKIEACQVAADRGFSFN